MAEIRRITPGDRVESDPTSGMVREEALATEGLWSGFVRTAPGATSGWHQHGDNQTTVYVLSGLLKLEFGPGGREVVVAEPGDFAYIPPHTIHRESNPSGEESNLIAVRAGHGPPTINVDRPEGGTGE